MPLPTWALGRVVSPPHGLTSHVASCDVACGARGAWAVGRGSRGRGAVGPWAGPRRGAVRSSQ